MISNLCLRHDPETHGAAAAAAAAAVLAAAAAVVLRAADVSYIGCLRRELASEE